MNQQIINRQMVLGLAVLLPALAQIVHADELHYPLAVASTPEGTLYIVDLNLPGVWKASDGKLELFFQASKKFRTPLNRPRCITLSAEGKPIVGDTPTREIYRFDEARHAIGVTGGAVGKPDGSSEAPKPDDEKPYHGDIGMPMAIVDDGKGNLFVSDLELHWIFKVPAKGGKAEKFAEVPAPRGMTIDGDGNLWVISAGPDQLVRVSPEGKVEPVVKGRPFSFPHDVVLDTQGIAYVSDGYSKAIWKVDASGKAEKWISGAPLVNPVGLEWRGDKLLIVDSRATAIFEADAEGKLTKLTLK